MGFGLKGGTWYDSEVYGGHAKTTTKREVLYVV